MQKVIIIHLDEKTMKDLNYLQKEAPKNWTPDDIIAYIIRDTAREIREGVEEEEDK